MTIRNLNNLRLIDWRKVKKMKVKAAKKIKSMKGKRYKP